MVCHPPLLLKSWIRPWYHELSLDEISRGPFSNLVPPLTRWLGRVTLKSFLQLWASKSIWRDDSTENTSVTNMAGVYEMRDAISRSSYLFSITYESHEKRLNNRWEQEVSIFGSFWLAIGIFRGKYEKKKNNLTNPIVVFNWITQLCCGCLISLFL